MASHILGWRKFEVTFKVGRTLRWERFAATAAQCEGQVRHALVDAYFGRATLVRVAEIDDVGSQS